MIVGTDISTGYLSAVPFVVLPSKMQVQVLQNLKWYLKWKKEQLVVTDNLETELTLYASLCRIERADFQKMATVKHTQVLVDQFSSFSLFSALLQNCPLISSISSCNRSPLLALVYYTCMFIILSLLFERIVTTCLLSNTLPCILLSLAYLCMSLKKHPTSTETFAQLRSASLGDHHPYCARVILINTHHLL